MTKIIEFDGFQVFSENIYEHQVIRSETDQI